jgi:SAM-dependent methyltransferase
MSTAAKSRSMPHAKYGGWELRMQCPQCSSALGILRQNDFPPEFLFSCTTCFFQMLNEDGIWRALPKERAAHFERFLQEYRTVREAEGRGSSNSEYYLSLPYADVSGHNQAQWKIRAKTFDHLNHIILAELESRTSRKLDILDLGAGNGWLSYRLGLRGHQPVAVDVNTSAFDGLAATVHYRQKLPRLFPCFQAELDCLPFADGQFDLAIFNASFHYSENYGSTLAETIRCLRPGGSVVIADTAWYTRDDSGRKMLAERRQAFTEQFGFPSDAITSQEYLTDERLSALATQFGLHWRRHSPYYGLRWAMRPLVAKLRRKREPSRFRIYVAEVAK